jgi:signal transduction histidine kinase
MGQVARTLNHELNNAMGTIELQLQLLSRKTGGAVAVEQYARQIREGLARMSATVEALKHVRRIVLTDYVSGVKMLDLEQSVCAEREPNEREPTERQPKGRAGQLGVVASPAGAGLT